MGEKLVVSRECVYEGNGGGARQCLVPSSTVPCCYLACHWRQSVDAVLILRSSPSPIYCLQNSKVSNSLLAPSSPRIFKLEGGY